MPLRLEIEARIRSILNGDYRITDTWTIPTALQLGLGKQGRLIETAVLFADVRKSSDITEEHRRQTAAKVYQSFLYAMARVARSDGGQIRAYDGDRIMVVFTPQRKEPNVSANKAVRTALRMAWCVNNVVAPELSGYDDIDCGIAVAFGKMLVVKAGIGGEPHNQDLVWVGRPANLAAKLSEAGRRPKNVWIDEETYNRLTDENKYVELSRLLAVYPKSIWQHEWITFAGQQTKVYSSQYVLPFD